MAITKNDVSKLYVALVNRVADKEGLDFWFNKGQDKSLSELANEMIQNEKTAADLKAGGVKDGDVNSFVTYIYKNLLNKADDTDGIKYWTDTATEKKADFGTILGWMLHALNDPEVQAKAPEVAKLYENKIAVAQEAVKLYDEAEKNGVTDEKFENYNLQYKNQLDNLLKNVTSDSASVAAQIKLLADIIPNPGETFDFTKDYDDVLVGTSKDDVFVGDSNTFNGSDSVDGKDGLDTLKLYQTAALSNDSLANFTIKNIEKLEVQTNNTVTFNKADKIESINDIEIVGDGGAHNMSVTGTNATAISFNGVGGTITTSGDKLQNVTLANKIGGATTITGKVGDTLNLNANNLNQMTGITFNTGDKLNVSLQGNDDALGTLTATALKELTIGGSASKATLALHSTTNAITNFTNNFNGDLNLTLVANAGLDSVKLGSGNDKVVVGTYAGKIDGGAGDDTIVLTQSGNSLTLDTAKYTNFEGLGIDMTGGTAVTADAGGLKNIELQTDAATTLAINNVVSGANLTLSKANSLNSTGLTLGIKAGTDTKDDVLNVKMAGTTNTLAGLVANKFETINIESAKAATTLSDITSADTTTLNITGDQATTVTTLAHLTALKTLDASKLKAALTITTSSASVDTIKGGEGALTLTVTAGAKTNVIGGDGNDSITFTTGAATITGGAGDDTYNATAVSASKSVFTTITDFAKGDRIVITGKGTATKTDAKIVLTDLSPDNTDGPSFDKYLNAAAVADGAANSNVAWFQYKGDTYIVTDMTASTTAFTEATDGVIKLAGLHELSLTASSQNVTVTLAS